MAQIVRRIGLYPVRQTPKGFVLLDTVANRGITHPKGVMMVFASSWRKAANLTLKGQGKPESMAAVWQSGFTVPTSLGWALLGSKNQTRQSAEARVAGWKADRKELAAYRTIAKDMAKLIAKLG